MKIEEYIKKLPKLQSQVCDLQKEFKYLELQQQQQAAQQQRQEGQVKRHPDAIEETVKVLGDQGDVERDIGQQVFHHHALTTPRL